MRKPWSVLMEERNRNEASALQQPLSASRQEDGETVAGTDSFRIRCITIIGQIEGHYAFQDGQKSTKYEHILPMLVETEEDREIDGLLILLNTMGGDVEAGLAIAELIAGMTKPTVSLVIGGGHSIGVPLAVSAKRSFIAPSATMTIHPVRYNGLVIGAEQAFWYLRKMQDRILQFIETHSHADMKRFRELMLQTDELASDMGTIISGREAVELGLIDEIGSLGDALRALRRQSNACQATHEVSSNP